MIEVKSIKDVKNLELWADDMNCRELLGKKLHFDRSGLYFLVAIKSIKIYFPSGKVEMVE